MNPELTQWLRCPLDKAVLTYDAEQARLVCTQCGKAYPIRDDIPVLLPDFESEDEKQT